MRYESKQKPGMFVTVTHRDEKRKTVIIEFEDGSSKCITTATLRTQYSLVPQQENTTSIETGQKKTINTCKKPSSKKPSSNNSEEVDKLLDYTYNKVTSCGGTIFTPANNSLKMKTFKIDGHMFIKMNYSSKSMVLGCRSLAVEKLGVDPDRTVHHMFDYNYVITTLNDETKELIDKLIQLSVEYQINKNNTEKEKK